MRINARLDESHSEKLRCLARGMNASITDVLKQAIDLYYEEMRAECRTAKSVLQCTGFIGVATGDENLSSNYKAELPAGLDDKYDHG